MGMDLSCDEPVARECHCRCDSSGPCYVRMNVSALIPQQGCENFVVYFSVKLHEKNTI